MHRAWSRVGTRRPNRFGNGQRLDTPLGKILHRTADTRGRFAQADIYAFGFRNPFRGSSDRRDLGGTGEILGRPTSARTTSRKSTAGCAGVATTAGTSRKDSGCSTPSNTTCLGRPRTGSSTASSPRMPLDMIDPDGEYDHDEGVAIIGGFVYRGTRLPGTARPVPVRRLLRRAELWQRARDVSRRRDVADPHERTPKVFNLINGHTNVFVLGLGEDRQGEVYVLANKPGIPFEEEGMVLRIVRRCADGRDCRD